MALEPGTEVGPYRIIEQVGQGGMALVYKAHQASLSRYIALKVLPPRLANDPDFLARFYEEAVRVAALRHPNILTVIDYGESNGVTYLVSEFVEGGTLAAQMGRPLPASYVSEVLGPIASALDYAHSRGVIHRDVKPSNILLALDGRPLLTDFGIARMVTPDDDASDLGAITGTPTYMAPEQGSGRPLAASDIYSVGVVAYEMLTGRPPFEGYTPIAVLSAHQNDPVPPPRSINPDISPAVEAALLKGLARNPDARFRTSGALVRAVEQAHVPSTVAAVPPAVPPADPGAPAWVGNSGGAAAGPPPPVVPGTGGGGGGQVPAGLAGKRSEGGGRRRALIIGGAVLLVLILIGGGAYLVLGRGGGGGLGQSIGFGRANTSPSPAVSPTPKHQAVLFAVLEQKGGQPSSYPPAHDTIAIVNVTGDAVAKATFAPRSIPIVGPAAPLLQPQARTAAGAVYYADGKGIIRALKPDGSASQAAGFTIKNSQTELAFAVSPDGTTIDATVLTFPAVVPPGPNSPFSGPGPGPLHLDLLQAVVGGANRTLSSKDIPQQPFPAPVLQMVGWDTSGAIATTNTALATQNTVFQRWFGAAHHIDNSGNLVSNTEFGGAGCNGQDVLPDATILCRGDDFRTVSARNSSGQTQWSLPSPPAGQTYAALMTLSPDAGMIAVGGGTIGTPAGIYKKGGGSRVTYPSNIADFSPEGWLDNDTVIGTNGPAGPGLPGEMWLVHPSSPTKAVDLGFKGNFAGVVQAAQ